MNERRFWILLFVLLLTSQRIEQISGQPGVGHRFLTSYAQESSDDNTTTTTIRPSCQHGTNEEDTNDQNTSTRRKQQEPTSQLKTTPAAAAAATEHSSSSSSDANVPNSEFFGIFKKLGTSWHTILQMFRSIVNNAGGKTMHKDVYVRDLKEGKEWLLQQEEYNWEELLQPHMTLYHDLERTFEDVLDSFLKWAASDEAKDGSCKLEGGVNGKESKINVSKALRRLEQYATWMSEMENDLEELTATSIKDTFSTLQMKMSIDDCQRLVWWLDLGAIDWELFDELQPKDIARVFVWISHYMLLNPNAQDQGLVLINSLNQIGFWPFMTMLPVDLGMQLDEFVISVIPIKTKFVVLMQRPPWAKFAYQMLKPFMKSNMRRRVVVIEEGL
eukprot:CAMPEP_0113604440 /NCGR_PEP_ID=MMETSP0017_2-20120614/1797_1 /TAXON_ID=2856 /ORGANISM="Cylindrotheca closterium" /LENGTH=386 /DNA_ID=CAMNT_0000512867 /DNA_START=103 /DNA_END=1260 /DNA_ORIENTATION=+ /assembly_acc=CAM_ASM_000147